MSANEVFALVDDGPMRRMQVMVVMFAITLHMLDGFDILVMAFTAPEIASDWSLSASQVGVLLSAGLIGMAFGSVFLAPLADKMGRRVLILMSLAMITVGMLLSAFCQNMTQFVSMRLLTGFGIGGILVSLTVITAEFTPVKWRTLCLTLFASGYPLGATISGAIAAILISDFGWRSVFLCGAICSALMIPLALFFLPESLKFMLSNPKPDTLEKVNKVLGRLGHQALQQLPPGPEVSEQRVGLRQLFTPGQRRSTLLLWLCFFAMLFNFYFIMSWTPGLLAAAGLSAEQGISGGVALNLGGIGGGFVLGYLAAFLNLKRLLAAFMLLAMIFTLAFSQFYTELGMALVIAVGIGFLLNAAIAGLFALGQSLYPVSVRSTGMGWAIGIGRVGALISPIVAGTLIEAGLDTGLLYVLFSISLLVSMTAVLLIRWESEAAGKQATV